MVSPKCNLLFLNTKIHRGNTKLQGRIQKSDWGGGGVQTKILGGGVGRNMPPPQKKNIYIYRNVKTFIWKGLTIFFFSSFLIFLSYFFFPSFKILGVGQLPLKIWWGGGGACPLCLLPLNTPLSNCNCIKKSVFLC